MAPLTGGLFSRAQAAHPEFPHLKVFTKLLFPQLLVSRTSILSKFRLNSPSRFPSCSETKKYVRSPLLLSTHTKKPYDNVAAKQTGLSPEADTSAIHLPILLACATQGRVGGCE